jgi:uncharacterized protein
VEFEWDPAKAASNLAKHNVDFAEAIGVFDDPRISTTRDARIAVESRYRAIGTVDDVTLFVVYTLRNGICRIISARRANRRERTVYSLQAGDRS